MLIILFGVSCVGKSALIRELRNQFGWLSIPTYMTRPLRVGETEKISVSHTDFIEMENKNIFLCVNYIFGNKYGTPRKEIELAVRSQESYSVLDFPVSKRYLFDDYRYLGFIILPKDEKQLIDQVKSSGRIDRLESILQEYRDDYAKYHIQEHSNASHISVVNSPNSLKETSKQIYSLATGFNI